MLFCGVPSIYKNINKRKLTLLVCFSGRFGCVGVRSGGRAFGRRARFRKVSVNVRSNAFMASPDDLAAWACGQMLLLSREPDARSEKLLKPLESHQTFKKLVKSLE